MATLDMSYLWHRKHNVSVNSSGTGIAVMEGLSTIVDYSMQRTELNGDLYIFYSTLESEYRGQSSL